MFLWWCFCNDVLNHRPKFCSSDGCRKRLLANIAQNSTEVMVGVKDC